MALAYDGAIQRLIDAFSKLPGIGPKGAQRIAFYILGSDEREAADLADAITEVKAKVKFCEVCGNVCEASPCPVCLDPRRDHSIICVVEEPKDVMSIERTREYHGSVTEVNLALDPNIEGEATTTYLSRLLSQVGIKVTRLASGLPVGSDLEYADEITLGRALSGRREA